MAQSDLITSFEALKSNSEEYAANQNAEKAWWHWTWLWLVGRPFLSILVVILSFRIIYVMAYRYSGAGSLAWWPATPQDQALSAMLAFFLAGVVWFGSWIAGREIQDVTRRSTQLQRVTVEGYAHISEVRYEDAHGHLSRMGRYAGLIAEALGRTEKYARYINAQYAQDILVAAPLHDVGKVGTAEQILNKRGPLSIEEYELMKMHTIVGGDLMAELESKIPHTSFYALGREIAYHHHQKWDGSGYPNVLNIDGTACFFVEKGVGSPLQGEEIPLSARIVALADVYDALRSKRCYKEAFSHETAKEMILREKGRHFDPDVVDAFLDAEMAILQVAAKFKDRKG